MNSENPQVIKSRRMTRRSALAKVSGAAAGLVLLNAYDSGDQGSDSSSISAPENGSESSVIVSSVANTFKRLLVPSVKEAKACHFESGPHNCAGTCPNEWVGNAVISSFIYKDNGRNGRFNKDVDEVWTTIPNGGRKTRLTLFGCEAAPSTTIFVASEQGDGVAIDQATGLPYVQVKKHGVIENWNWRDGNNKQTGRPEKIAFVRAEIDRFAEDGVSVHRDPKDGKLSRWQVCIDVCPEGVTPVESTDISVSSGFSPEEIAQRGYVKKNGMYVPQYASELFDRVPDNK